MVFRSGAQNSGWLAASVEGMAFGSGAPKLGVVGSVGGGDGGARRWHKALEGQPAMEEGNEVGAPHPT